ncbi:hypothetical protein BC834DRAFT_307175 [Gloeopeniophorella convolvens]|nr:hypothetical protein BC834DRAFT_307175 [Gloeopeniophorella convolvens]
MSTLNAFVDQMPLVLSQSQLQSPLLSFPHSTVPGVYGGLPVPSTLTFPHDSTNSPSVLDPSVPPSACLPFQSDPLLTINTFRGFCLDVPSYVIASLCIGRFLAHPALQMDPLSLIESCLPIFLLLVYVFTLNLIDTFPPVIGHDIQSQPRCSTRSYPLLRLIYLVPSLS